MKKFCIFSISIFLLVACDSSKSTIHPQIFPPQQMIAPTDGSKSITVDIFAKAIKETIYNDLSKGPLLLMVYQGDTLEKYLNEKNISSEQFLQSKTLNTYMKAHLLPNFFDRNKLLSTPGMSSDYTNALGEKVTITMLDNGHASITGGGVIKLSHCYQAAHEQNDTYPDYSYVCVMEKPLDFR